MAVTIITKVDGVVVERREYDPPNVTLWRFGRYLKWLRQGRDGVHHITITELAEKSGISGGAISRLERGETDPRLTTLVALAKGLDVGLDVLLGFLRQEVK